MCFLEAAEGFRVVLSAHTRKAAPTLCVQFSKAIEALQCKKSRALSSIASEGPLAHKTSVHAEELEKYHGISCAAGTYL